MIMLLLFLSLVTLSSFCAFWFSNKPHVNLDSKLELLDVAEESKEIELNYVLPQFEIGERI